MVRVSYMNTNEKLYENIATKESGEAELEIRGDIPLSTIVSFKPETLTRLAKNIELPGFRKGHVPASIAQERLGEVVILEETVGTILSRAYPEILRDLKIDAIGRPEISIVKLAPGNQVQFVAKTALAPTVTLPDYKELAAKKREEFGAFPETFPVGDEEVTNAIDQLRKGQKKEEREAPLPPLSDEIAKEFGLGNAEEFKTKVRERLAYDKKRREKEKRRSTIADTIIEKTKATIPRLVVDRELDTMLAEFKNSVAGLGITFEEYLTKIEKTPELLKSEWGKDARRRATLGLLLDRIGEAEHITIPEEELIEETKHFLAHYTHADPENVRIFVRTMLTNEKVFRFLEGETSETENKTPSHDHKHMVK